VEKEAEGGQGAGKSLREGGKARKEVVRDLEGKSRH